MVDECQVSLTGYVATQPQTKTFRSGASNVSMRVAWTERRRDRLTGEWIDGNTSYVTVYCWRKIGTNVAVSLRTGDPVVVKGKLLVRTYEDNNGNRRNVVDVDASSIGHDLSRGVSKFLRVRPETGMTAAEYDAARAAGQLPSPAGNGAAPAAGDGRAGVVDHAAGDGGPLRFAGGLEPAADGLPAMGGLPGPGEPDGWPADPARADLDGAAEAEPEPEPEAGAEPEAEPESGAELAAAGR